ncbi:hypothetical protein NIES2101_11365 [Calothrix sp. HK-06]|nr:hypothetical protein NIES2101_11365 [Calothrix sp. HK-06]
MQPHFQHDTSDLAEFIEEYNCFLKHYGESQAFKKKNTHVRDNTEKISEYTQAVDAHLDATKAYIRLVGIYERLILKCWNSVHTQDY